MWAGMVWIGTRGPLTAEGQVTTQSPSLSSLKASAERRNDSLMLSGIAAGSHWKDLVVVLFVLWRERNCPKRLLKSHCEFRGFRGSILPYNPEKNEVSIKRFLNVKPLRQYWDWPKANFRKIWLEIHWIETCLYTAAQTLFCVWHPVNLISKQWRIYCKSNVWIYIKPVRYKLDFRSTLSCSVAHMELKWNWQRKSIRFRVKDIR